MVFQFSNQLSYSGHWSKCGNNKILNVFVRIRPLPLHIANDINFMITFKLLTIFGNISMLYGWLGSTFRLWLLYWQYFTVKKFSKLRGLKIHPILLSLKYNLDLLKVPLCYSLNVEGVLERTLLGAFFIRSKFQGSFFLRG